jgi:hypothetical protein
VTTSRRPKRELAFLAAASAAKAFGSTTVAVLLPQLLYKTQHSLERGARGLLLNQGLALLGLLLGAGGSVVVGPRLVGLAGALLAALGALGLAAGASLVPAQSVLTLGSAIFEVAPYAAAAALLVRDDPEIYGSEPALSPRRFAAVTAFFFLLAFVSQLSWLVAPALASAMIDHESFALPFGFAAFAFVLAVTFVALSGELRVSQAGLTDAIQGPYRSPPLAPTPSEPQPMKPNSRALQGLALLVLPAALGVMTSQRGLHSLINARALWVLTAGGVVGTVLTAIVVVVFYRAARDRALWPPMVLWSYGVIALGVGSLLASTYSDPAKLDPVGPILVSANDLAPAVPSVALLTAGQLLTSSAMDCLHPIGLVYAALSLPPRFSPLAIAGWLAVSWVSSSFAGVMITTSDSIPTTVSIVVGVLLLVMGVTYIVNARAMHRGLFREPVAPSPSA